MWPMPYVRTDKDSADFHTILEGRQRFRYEALLPRHEVFLLPQLMSRAQVIGMQRFVVCFARLAQIRREEIEGKFDCLGVHSVAVHAVRIAANGSKDHASRHGAGADKYKMSCARK
jgi:hypothetical protein